MKKLIMILVLIPCFLSSYSKLNGIIDPSTADGYDWLSGEIDDEEKMWSCAVLVTVVAEYGYDITTEEIFKELDHIYKGLKRDNKKKSLSTTWYETILILCKSGYFNLYKS